MPITESSDLWLTPLIGTKLSEDFGAKDRRKVWCNPAAMLRILFPLDTAHWFLYLESPADLFSDTTEATKD